MFIRNLNHTKPLKAPELADMMKRMPAQTVIQTTGIELHDDGVRIMGGDVPRGESLAPEPPKTRRVPKPRAASIEGENAGR